MCVCVYVYVCVCVCVCFCVGCSGTCGGEETCVWIFGYEGLKEIDRLKDVGIDGRIILKRT